MPDCSTIDEEVMDERKIRWLKKIDWSEMKSLLMRHFIILKACWMVLI